MNRFVEALAALVGRNLVLTLNFRKRNWKQLIYILPSNLDRRKHVVVDAVYAKGMIVMVEMEGCHMPVNTIFILFFPINLVLYLI
jgi:hypothetical protein